MKGKLQIAFIGLGVMGFPMAGHLANAGHILHVYNRSPQKTQKWLSQFPGIEASSPKDAVIHADIVITCVGDDRDLENVLLGRDSVIESLAPSTLIIDHSTVSAEITQKIAEEFALKKISYVDAPVSGGEQGAKTGKLSIMCGGKAEDFENALPIISTYAKAVTHIGEPIGSGQLAKMVNQICIAGLIQGLAEGIHFAESMQLDIEKVFSSLSQGAAQSWQMINRYQTMAKAEYNHGFAVKWMRKDLAICLQEARKKQTSLPITALVDQFYGEVENLGGSLWDTSSLLERLRVLKSKT